MDDLAKLGEPEDIKEDTEILKPKKEKRKQSEKQVEQFKMATQKRAENAKTRLNERKIESAKLLLENDFKVKKKKIKAVEPESETESESEEEEEVIVVKKKKRSKPKRKKIITIEVSDDDTSSEDEEPIVRKMTTQQNKRSVIKVHKPPEKPFFNCFTDF